jgi:hypothetical protein
MDPQIVFDLFNTEPEYQICWFWMLLGKIAGAAKAAAGAVATGAKAAATTISEGAASSGGGAAAVPAATTAATAATAAPAAVPTAAVSGTAATAAPAAGAGATALETFVNVASESAPAATATPAAPTVMGSGTPVAGTTSPTTFPAGTFSPSVPTAGGGTATGSGTTPAPATPSLMEQISAFLEEAQAPIKKTDSATVKLAKNLRDLSQKGDPPEKAQSAPGSLQAEQAIAPSESTRIPELQRAKTVSAPIGLKLATGDKDGEPPLSFDQLKGLQRSGIDELVSELRLQRRLFG